MTTEHNVTLFPRNYSTSCAILLFIYTLWWYYVVLYVIYYLLLAGDLIVHFVIYLLSWFYLELLFEEAHTVKYLEP